MPYCPKCDMEFVEGMTVCTDCHGPLAESREAAETLKKEEKAKQEEEMRRHYEELTANQEDAAESEEEKNLAPIRAYVKKEQRYEDMNSSASAFFLVGGLLALLSVVFWTGMITLPISGFSRYMFQGVITVMAVGSLVIAFSSKKSAKTLKVQADEEARETEEILQWFTRTYSGSDMDTQLLSEDPDLAGEELSLKRFELIQDYLVTGRDLPDQSYVDSLCDMIYARLYDSEK